MTTDKRKGQFAGVAGTYEIERGLAGTFKCQTFTTEPRALSSLNGMELPSGWTIRAHIRFDDSCGNGHNSFGIVADIYERGKWEAGGCQHEAIAAAFPELAPFIRWHLCSSDGPMHYIANTTYLASDRDHYGLRKGEMKQITKPDGTPRWTLEAVNADGVAISNTPTGKEYAEKETVPLFILKTSAEGDAADLPANPSLKWIPLMREGKGKARELDAARRAAVWPEATDAELAADKEDLTKMLQHRLPGLLAAMKSELTAAGFDWTA